MSLNSLKIENFSVSLEFFNNLKAIMDVLLNYIKEYRIATLDYNTRLQEIGKNYTNKIEKIITEISSKEKYNLSKILSFINSIPKIIESSTNNFKIFKEEIEKELRVYENLNPDLIIPSCKSQFEKIKSNLIKKEKELKITQDNFFNEMFETEKKIYTYYYTHQENDKNNDKKEKSQKAVLVSEENMENSIINSKKKEDEYKSRAKEGKIEEENFVKFSRFYSESVKKITNEIFEKLKHLILDFLIALKNYFKIPQTELDIIIPDLIKLDKSLNIDKQMEKLYHNDNEYKSLFNPEKYNLYVLDKKASSKIKVNNKKSNNKSQNILDKVEIKVHEFEDGFGTICYIEDINTLLTLKKMRNNFELINLNNIDIPIEEEKRKMHYLVKKLLSNFHREKEYEPEELNITEEEEKLIESLIEKPHNRSIFLQLLNKFRSKGKFIMNKKLYDYFGKLFNFISDKIKYKQDIFASKNIIILSQTYFYKNGDKKEYLQNKIINHKLFKDHKFWEELFNFEMQKEILKLTLSDTKRLLENYIDEKIMNDKKKYANLAFGQIMTLSNNMIEFGLSSEEIFKIMEPKIKFYELNEDLIENIKCVLKLNKEEKMEKNDNMVNVDIDNKVKDDKTNDNIINPEEDKNITNNTIENKNDELNKINENENIINING